VGKAIETVLS